MTDIWSYPKVWNLGHPALEALLDGDVVIQEKVDGSQFSWRWDGEDDLDLRSKGAVIHRAAPDKMFARAVESVEGRLHKLHPGWVYRGEYLMKPKHNALFYSRVPEGNIILFDVETEPDRFLPPEELALHADHIGLEHVTQFTCAPTHEEYMKLLELESALGGVRIEGVVVKNYGQFGKDGKVLMGKHVSEAFKETHKKEWKAGNPTARDVVQTLIDELRTPARWGKAVQHLAEAGELEHDPRDIGKLIKEVQRDLEEEEVEYVKQKLYDHFFPQIRRGASGGVAEWYKAQLFERQFEEKIQA